MLTQEKELERMRLYFNGRLKGKDLELFKTLLEGDSNFRHRVFVERMVFEAANEISTEENSSSMNTISAKGLQDAKQLSMTLESELFGKDDSFLEEWEVDIDVEPVYSLEELLAVFKPIEHFEAANKRSQAVLGKEGLDALVKQPLAGIDCANFKLNFELTEALPFELEVTVLNNQEDIVHTQIIAPQSLHFEVTLFFLEAKAGKYYWRLKANTRDRGVRRAYKSVVRSFFLHKGLNPYR